MFCFVLFCFVLFCFVLFCFVLFLDIVVFEKENQSSLIFDAALVEVDLLVDDVVGNDTIATSSTPVIARRRHHGVITSASAMKRSPSGAVLVDESNVGAVAQQSPTLVKVGVNQLLHDDDMDEVGEEPNQPLLPTAQTGIGATPVSTLQATLRFLTTEEFRESLPVTLPLMASSFFLTSTSAVFEFVATPLTIGEYDFDVTENSVVIISYFFDVCFLLFVYLKIAQQN